MTKININTKPIKVKSNNQSRRQASLSERTEKKLNFILTYKIWSTLICTIGVIIWLFIFFTKIYPITI